MNLRTCIRLLAAVLAGIALPAAADYDRHKLAKPFIERMVEKHGFERRQLREILDEADYVDEIIEAMEKPAEKKLSWGRYRQIFMRPDRIEGGARFLRDNRVALTAAEEKYGVPAEVMVAIIGVETWYGRHTGKYRVLDALATLGFDYPKRGEFFRSELEQFLLMCREEKLDPTEPLGSYAGAMGLPQFIPSSFRHYAVDFNGNGHRNLWTEPEDALGSIGNYLSKRGWKRGEPIAAQIEGGHDAAEDIKPSRLEPLNRYGELTAAGVKTAVKADADAPAGILELDGEDGDEYWVALKNFFVITTYNRSPLYAMAVFQLSQAIRAQLLADELG